MNVFPFPLHRPFKRVFVRGSHRACVLTVVFAFFTAITSLGEADVVDIAYSFSDDDSGGAALVSIEDQTGRILSTEPIFDVGNCQDPNKIRRTDDKRTVAVTNLPKDSAGPNLFLWYADTPNQVKGLKLKSNVDEIRITNDFAFLTLKKDDSIAAINLESQEITHRQLDKLLTPPANGPEDLIVGPNEKYVTVSFQMDSGKGKKRGNRIAIFTLPDLSVVADLPLPRARTDLHIPGNHKQQGPGPEVLHISEASDTLTVTLDLYGAVGLMSWSDAVAGSTQDWTMVSTSDSNVIAGQSFPDRATSVLVNDREYYVVCNAGKKGGSVLIDIENRDVVWRMSTPAGLEAPVYVPALRKAFSVCSGKTKFRQGGEVKKSSDRKQDLYVFDFRRLPAARPAPVVQFPLNMYTTQIKLVSSDPPLLLIAAGPNPLKEADTLLTVDPVTGIIKDRRAAVGPIVRFE